MGEAWGGDRRPGETGPTEHVPSLEKADRGGREGRLELSVPQVAGSAVAAVVAAKLASNLGVYGTIVGAGVVSVLGTCGGSVLQHVFRRTGRQVQVVAVQARPTIRRVRAARTDTADRTRPLTETGHEGTRPLTGTSPATDTGTGTDPATTALSDAYGEPTSYRAGRGRNWKRPVVGLVIAFGLTMGGITGYEAIAGENISGHGHGTTIGNAVTGHDSPHSGGTRPTPAPDPSDTSGTTGEGGATTPQHQDGGQWPSPHTTPSTPHPGSSPSGDPRPTRTPTAPTDPDGPTSAPPTPTPTPSQSFGDGGVTP
ncbi:hypothetical protein OG900_22435 [Streptomyces sp. NBC_00433]